MRAEIVTNHPLDMASPERYKQLQYDLSESTLDDRPCPNVDIPSIPLLYEGFGHFLDIMDGRDDVPGLADVNIQELWKAVDHFANKMTELEHLVGEDARRDAALSCLGRIFSARRGIKIPSLRAAGRTSGHNTAPHGAGSMVIEVRNWSSDPHVEDGDCTLHEVKLVCDVARLIATKMDVYARRELYLRWRVPCLGLTIVGELDTFAFQ